VNHTLGKSNWAVSNKTVNFNVVFKFRVIDSITLFARKMWFKSLAMPRPVKRGCNDIVLANRSTRSILARSVKTIGRGQRPCTLAEAFRSLNRNLLNKSTTGECIKPPLGEKLRVAINARSDRELRIRKTRIAANE